MTLKSLCLFITLFFARSPILAQTVFTVINTNDGGTGSLRQAILDANGTAGADTIKFDLPGAGSHTISPASELPEIVETLVIRGYTQSGASVATASTHAIIMIELDGSNAGDDSHGLFINADNCIVRGLAINRFGRGGIYLPASGCKIQGNYIGTNSSGTQALGNGFRSTDQFVYDAIWIDDSANNEIGGTDPATRNVLSANAEAGVYVGGSNATGNKIQGNYIGLDAAGTQDFGNGFSGVILDAGAANNFVGGNTGGAGNVISGNDLCGVEITRNGGANTIQGNYIGTDAAGTQGLGNTQAGICIINGSDNLIGGTESGTGNLISGNGAVGIALVDGGRQNTIQGNFLGTDFTGTQAIGNGDAGVLIRDSRRNLIGGTVAGARNVISGNLSLGIGIEGTRTLVADGNTVQGNYIGLDVTGTHALGNGANGVGTFSSSFNRVGGTKPGAGNVISANGGTGVRFARNPDGPPAMGNVVQGNYIGTDANGVLALGNQFDGVSLSSSSDNIIGGTSDAAGNVIAGHGFAGVFLSGALATSNTVQGNKIGTDAKGEGLLPNSDSGVDIFLAENNLIGGTEEGAANIIAGNLKSGVALRLSSTTSSIISQPETVQTNFSRAGILNKRIAGRKSKVTTRANSEWSERFFFSAMSGRSGRETTAPGFISESAGRAPGEGNEIRRNIMFDNVELGIDLLSVVRGNDSDDSDSGENKGQNYPEIQMATGDGSRLSVDYLVSSSAANSAYPLEVEFFLASTDDEGKVYLGTDTYPNANTTKTATINPDIKLNDGDKIVATSTDASGNTSEFSDAFAITGTVSVEELTDGLPQTFALEQNYPNPFNPTTTIQYSLISQSDVELKIYDTLGKLVRTLVRKNQVAGEYSAVWDGKSDSGRPVASGHYFYKFKTGEFQSTKYMILLK